MYNFISNSLKHTNVFTSIYHQPTRLDKNIVKPVHSCKAFIGNVPGRLPPAHRPKHGIIHCILIVWVQCLASHDHLHKAHQTNQTRSVSLITKYPRAQIFRRQFGLLICLWRSSDNGYLCACAIEEQVCILHLLAKTIPENFSYLHNRFCNIFW